MNLNSININQVIDMSRRKLSIKKLLMQCLAFFTGVICASSLFCDFVCQISLPWSGWLAMAGCSAIYGASKVIAFHKAKRQANEQLTALAKHLSEEGIDVSRLSLKKARLGMKMPRFVLESYGEVCIIENVAVFEDRTQKLRALKQLRSEVVREFRKPTSEDVIDGNWTETITDSTEAEKFLVLMNMYRR